MTTTTTTPTTTPATTATGLTRPVRSAEGLRGLCGGAVHLPGDDASLVRASDQLLRFESAVRAALVPSTTHPDRRPEGPHR